MARDYITINGVRIRQPDEAMEYNFETTYTEDSTRVQSGKGHFSPMFTVESFSYEASHLTKTEMKTILQLVVGKTNFELHYFSPYYGCWRDDLFYVGQGSLVIGSLVTGSIGGGENREERYDSLSFNMIGVNPI